MKRLKFWKLLTMLAIVVTSCKDFLTVDPENRTVTDGYYTSNQRVEQAVIGSYVDLRRALLANQAWLMYGEGRTGELTVNTTYAKYVSDQKLKADNNQIEQLSDWGYFYDAIRSANETLEIVEAAGSDVLNTYQRNTYKGEALAVKSMSYFYLARIWGDILSAEKNDKGQKLSNDAAVTKAAAFAKEAIALLPWRFLNDDGIESNAITLVRLNKTAAYMLLAQQELWLGKGTEARATLMNLYSDEATDKLSDFSISMGEDRITPISKTPLSSSLVSMKLPVLDSIYPTLDTRRGSLFSFTASGATLIVRDQSVLPLLKLAEIDLLLAEASWKAGNLEEAIEHLILSSKGATEDYSTLTESDFKEALLLERQRQLVGTGQRFFDLIRFGEVHKYVPSLSESDIASGAAYWPLSPESLSGNKLSQNSFWSR